MRPTTLTLRGHSVVAGMAAIPHAMGFTHRSSRISFPRTTRSTFPFSV